MTATIPDPYGRTIFHGRPLDHATVAALKVAERRLGYELTIVQGIGGATASAGTHTEGRAVDLASYDWQRKVRVLRDLGFAAWFRPTLPGVWGAHIHAVLIFEWRSNSKGLADAAVRQIGSYDRGRDGLAGDNVDPNPYRPSPPALWTVPEYRATFEAPVERPTRNRVTRSRDRLVEARQAVEQAVALLSHVDEDREVVRAQIPRLRELRGQLDDVLDRMPKT